MAHDLHFIINFLVKNSILHKLSLLQFFCGKDISVTLCRYLVNGSKCSLPDESNNIVL